MEKLRRTDILKELYVLEADINAERYKEALTKVRDLITRF